MSSVGVADVIAVRSPGWFSRAIRTVEGIQDVPDISNHVVIVSHRDPQGHWWGLEARPGGVGWCEVAPLLGSQMMLNNISQPDRDSAGRQRVAARAKAMLGTDYDWLAVADNVIRAFAPQARSLWNQAFQLHGQPLHPAQVMCSAYAAYLYASEHWAHPEAVTDREVNPGDWDQFILTGSYSVPAADLNPGL